MASNSLSKGGTVVVATGVVFLVDSFLPWFRECVKFLGTKACGSESAWGTGFSLLATLLVIALVAEVVAVQLLDQKLPPVGQFSWAQIRLVVAGIAAALVVIQFLVGDHGVSRSYGIYLGILLVAGVVYGTLARNNETTPASI